MKIKMKEGENLTHEHLLNSKIHEHMHEHMNCNIHNDMHMKFFNVMCKFKNNFHMDRMFGMKKSEYTMLITIDCAIRDSGKTTVSTISKAMKMTRAAVSKTIGELENQGYVIKVVNKEDKRQVYIELTEIGHKRLNTVKAEINNFADTVFQKFGSDNANQLLGLLETMYEITADEIEIRKDKYKQWNKDYQNKNKDNKDNKNNKNKDNKNSKDIN